MTGFNHTDQTRGHQLTTRFTLLPLLALLLFVQPVAARDGEPSVCAGITEPVFDVMLSFPVPGIITAQKFKEGEFVKAGDIILELDSRLEELEVERYRLIMENKKTDWESTKTVFDKTSSVSRDELLKKEADYRVAAAEHQIAVEQLSRRRLSSPADGVIAEIKLHAGEACAAYQPVARVVDTRRCYFVSNLEARDAARFKLNQPVDLEFEDGLGSVKVKGKITFVSPVVDAASGLQKIKAVLDNESGKIRPGLAGKMSPESATAQP